MPISSFSRFLRLRRCGGCSTTWRTWSYLQEVLFILQDVMDHGSVSRDVQQHPLIFIQKVENRQVTVIAKDPRQTLEEMSNSNYCPKAFRRTIQTTPIRRPTQLKIIRGVVWESRCWKALTAISSLSFTQTHKRVIGERLSLLFKQHPWEGG